jgi:sugar phosphate isomerase/epimerase
LLDERTIWDADGLVKTRGDALRTRECAMAGLPLAGCTFGWLHQAPLADALRSLASRDVHAVELTTSPPHLFTRHFGRSADLLGVVRDFDRPRLRVAYDVANALGQEDPAEGVARLGGCLGLAHVSDAWRGRWAHTSVGRGEVDFAGFAAALAAAGFAGPTVYELVDGEDPAPRLAADFAALGKAGWELS